MTPRLEPWLTFYGDDFTGSSAVMEVLAFAGVPTAMFLDVPDAALLARFPNLRAIGIAGIARSKSPEWMDRELPRFLSALHQQRAPILHYKTCSTFDSSPALGSIGRAAEIGLAVTNSKWAPLVVGAPAIGRYQMFGNLFAGFDGVVHRLDRHPVMSRHPATPMHESDLCRHLAVQTNLATATVDFRAILGGTGSGAIDTARSNGARIVALDLFDEATCAEVGALLWKSAGTEPLLAVGSQGVEYALVAHWRRNGMLPPTYETQSLAAVDRLLVVSGSCSVVTARQIGEAERAGFSVFCADVEKAVDTRSWQSEVQSLSDRAVELLRQGRSVVVCTAKGPDDPSVGRLSELVARLGSGGGEVHSRIGDSLGAIVLEARKSLRLQRALIAGGDTSGHALMALGAAALVPQCPLDPGVPVLKVISQSPEVDGIEVALKGGQMGRPDVFVRMRDGNA